VVVSVPAGMTGVSLAGGDATLASLILDGSAEGAVGIRAQGGSNFDGGATEVHLHDLTVRRFVSSGIYVTDGARIAVGPGVSSVSNAIGLLVDSGRATVLSASTPVAFNDNTNVGIKVVATGSLTLSGTPSSGGAGTVLVQGNHSAGLWLEQASPNLAIVTGVVATGNNPGDGIRVTAGSPLILRSSIVVGNGANGVRVATGSGSVGSVDLGTVHDGSNTLQQAANPNGGAGLCLEGTGTLEAQGNVFSGHDCAQAVPGYSVSRGSSCAGGFDVGTPGGGVVHVSNCD
jgi:hypothetical protein